MSSLEPGMKAPDFTLPADGGNEIALSDLKGTPVIIYFYPKDDTPGCTTESCDFRDNIAHFNAANARVIGISKDSIKKHEKFKKKYDLNFPLASDENGNTCDNYGVWVEKNMYGRTYMGIERTTFLLDENGIILKIWRKVKVPGHINDVMTALGEHKKAA